MRDIDTSIELEKKLVDNANRLKIPLTANFELTPTCTLDCDMCFIRMNERSVNVMGGIHSLDEWLHLASQLRQLGTLFILLTGGEPMLHPDFKNLYVALRKMGFIITINTNGTLIDEEICKLFTEMKPRRINVTLYGASENTYKLLCHNEKGFDRCVNGLRLLEKYDIDTKINVIVVEENKKDYDKIMSVASSFGMPVLVNSYMFPALRSACHGCRDVVSARLSPENSASFNQRYIEYKKGLDYGQYVYDTLSNVGNSPANTCGIDVDCRAANSAVWINWQHLMTPCMFLEFPSEDLKIVSVSDAWKSLVGKVQKLPRHEDCIGCKLRPVCQVCYASAYYEKKAMGKIDYLCHMAKEEIRILKDEEDKRIYKTRHCR